MGHGHPETTAAYVHLNPETLAAEYVRARQGNNERFGGGHAAPGT